MIIRKRKMPSVKELQKILDSTDKMKIVVCKDGSIKAQKVRKAKHVI